jgi:phosphatidylserine/phosphatidylglycerophosphate/cardiolipin synthase-like enzyme
MKIRTALAALVVAALAPALATAQPTPATVDTCFVPAEPCAGRIVAAIDSARASIRVEAYGFSARPIIAALLRAKDRGVDVAVLLDRSNEHGHGSGLAAMQRAGIPVWIDRVPGIAHVKAIIIDSRVVIGGSYNYTASAERRNVEDVTVTVSPEVAAEFTRNWQARQARAATQ